MMSNILQVKQPIAIDDSITSMEYHTYTPYSSSYNNNDEVRISIQSQDLYVLPTESYLYIHFNTTRRNGNAIQQGDGILTSNFIAHLFNEMRYEINGFEVDRCKTPGITSLMKTLVACKSIDKGGCDLYFLNDGRGVDTGECYMILPLKFIFGFCDDFNKIIMNSRHELILVRSRTDDNAYIGNQDISFVLQKIHWKMPHVTLNDRAKLTMLKTVKQNDYLPLAYRSWDLYELPALPQTTRYSWNVKTTTQVTKPRYVIVTFQTGRNFVGTANNTQFDHCNVTNIKLYMNNQRFPYDDMNLNFLGAKYHELFNMFKAVQKSYYNGSGGLNPYETDYGGFLLTPVFAFDCSRTEESIKSGMVDIRVEIQTSDNFPENTSAYCLIIHDNLVRYSPFTGMVYRDI